MQLRALLLLAGAAVATPGLAASGVADLLIVHGKVYPADGSGRFVQAVAVKDGRILAVGTDAAMMRLRGAPTRVIDAHGGAVTPGLIDTHTHLMGGAAVLEQASVSGVNNGTELAQRLKAYADAHPEKKVIQAAGHLPTDVTRFDIDDAAGGRPIFVASSSGHWMLLNSAALAMAGLSDSDRPDPMMPRDAQGRLTGRIMEDAQARAQTAVPQPDEAGRRRMLDLATRAAHAAGVTSAVVVGGQGDLQLFERARADKALNLRITFAQWLTRNENLSNFPDDFAFAEKDADRLDKIRQAFRDDPLLTFDTVKIMSDGVVESHTGALLEPYADQPDNHGQENYSKEDLNRIVGMMDRRGWQIMIHALGDRAVRWALDSLELAAKVNKAPVAGRRHKIEHLETVDPADVPRFGRLHVTASLQPAHFSPRRAEVQRKLLGSQSKAWGWPWKSIKQSGGLVSFGSDWPVAPLNIGPGAYNAVTRPATPPAPDQRLTMRDIIDGYTRDAARSVFRDKDLGSLVPGKRADIVIFRDDIFTAPPHPGDIAVANTFMDGRLVYASPETPAR
jgi:predicted amidohydrolase YtcJ